MTQNDSSLPYLAYAGIGSRETPGHILHIMHSVGAHLWSHGWTLRSGAAHGADAAFEKGHDESSHMVDGQPAKEIYLPWAGYNHSTSELHTKNYPFSEGEMGLSARFHPAWDRCSPSAKRLHARNTRILLGMEAIHGEVVRPVNFIVCWTKEGKVTGGTGQALRIAKAIGIRVFNLGEPTSSKELEAMLIEMNDLQQSIKEKSIKEKAL